MTKTLRDQIFAMDRTQTLFGHPMLQSYAALVVYEELLRHYRKSINWVWEVGTGHGALSLYFALWSCLNNTPFKTIDDGSADWAQWSPSPTLGMLLKNLGATVLRGSCFSLHHQKQIADDISKKPGLLFCDGGKKGKEVQTFGSQTASGSIIVAHDWPIEINESDVDKTDGVMYLEPWHTQSLELGTKAAILVRSEV
jgi:hypothetical protein